MTGKKVPLLIVFFVVGLSVVAAPVAATVSITTSSEYLGGEEGNSQAVELEYTFSPDETEMTDVRIEVDPTDRSFIDYNSFSRTINPGDADVSIETVEQGTFEISNVQPNQEITISFDAYPRTIQQRQLDVAAVEISYVQQGQSLSNTTKITADLSDSAWFQLQDAQNGDGGGSLLSILLVLIVGLGVGGGTVYVMLEPS